MEQIINKLINNFDFALIVVINVCTYLLIKLLDELNKEKIVGTWQKRFIFVMSSIMIGIIYKNTADIPIYIIVNSIIIAPITWSWLAKPIAKALGIDYRKEDDLLNNLFK